MEVMEVIRDIKMPGWAVKELTPLPPTHLILRTDGGEFLFLILSHFGGNLSLNQVGIERQIPTLVKNREVGRMEDIILISDLFKFSPD